jgi:ATP-binding cassette, subfamily B, bacterial
VLRGLDLEIAAGEAVAIVAASGGGKSTLAALLLRHLEAGRGRIAIDGVDVRERALADLRRAVCVVEQEPFLFTASVRENVCYGSWSAAREEVEEAIRMAGLETFVRSLPRGLDEAIREAGRNLSGGQKQRIALARAIVRDPPILVLDEATSAIDSEVEGRIFAGLESWLARRTVLAMAHRLSTVRRFDRVVVIQDGRVVGDGPVDSLLRTCPGFADLFADQVPAAESTRVRRAGGSAA